MIGFEREVGWNRGSRFVGEKGRSEVLVRGTPRDSLARLRYVCDCFTFTGHVDGAR